MVRDPIALLRSAAMSDTPAPAPDSTPSPPPAPAGGTPPPGTTPIAGSGIVRLATGFYGVVGLFAVGFALFSDDVGILLMFGEKAPEPAGLLAGIGVGLVIVGVTRVGVRMWGAIEDAARILSVMLGPLTKKQAILLAVLSGVGEELLFRGALWPDLGLWGTTLLFGLVHVIPKRQLWGYPLFAVAAGLLFGVLRMGTGSVVPCVLAHVTVNAINLIWLSERYAEFVRQDAAEHIAREAHGS